jgi:hypothetical protein
LLACSLFLLAAEEVWFTFEAGSSSSSACRDTVILGMTLLFAFGKPSTGSQEVFWDVELCTKVFAALLLTEMGFCPSLDTQEVNDTLHMVTLSVDTTTVLILS